MAPTGTGDSYQGLKTLGERLPLVLVDRALPDLGLDAATVDSFAGAFEATSHLIDLGHRKVATITGPCHLAPARDRLNGFRAALEARGLEVRPDFIRSGSFREEEAMAGAQDLLSGADRRSAVFVANNHMMIGVLRAIAALQLSCPKEVSVVGIDDFPWANAFTPRLTVVRQPVEEIGRAAVRLLLARIAGQAPQPVHEVLRSDLVIRDSCAPFPLQ